MQSVRVWSGRSESQILGQSNRTQCCQRITTLPHFFKMSCVARAQWRAIQTRNTFWRNTASIMKNLICEKNWLPDCFVVIVLYEDLYYGTDDA